MQCDTNLAYEKCTIAFHSSAELFFSSPTLSKWFHHIAQLFLDNEEEEKKSSRGHVRRIALYCFHWLNKPYCFMCVYGTRSSFTNRNPKSKIKSRMRGRKIFIHHLDLMKMVKKFEPIRIFFRVFFLMLLLLPAFYAFVWFCFV